MQVLSLENYKYFLQEIKKAGCLEENLSICLDGEPFMNKYMCDFIEIANREGFLPTFGSNGRLLTREIIDRIKECRFRAAIDFSADATIFESIRGKEGDFPIVLENLQHLAECAKKNPYIRLTLTDISCYKNKGGTDSLERLRNLFHDLPGNVYFATREFHSFGGHMTIDAPQQSYKLCPYPWYRLTLTWDGNAVACCRDTPGRTVLGNIFKQSIADIWYGEPYVEFRKKLLAKKPEEVAACKGCDLPWGGGRHRWKLSNVIRVLARKK